MRVLPRDHLFAVHNDLWPHRETLDVVTQCELRQTVDLKITTMAPFLE